MAVVLPGFRDFEMVTSLMVALTSEKNVSWYLREGSRISSTWLTKSQLDHWPIWIIGGRDEVKYTFSQSD